MTPLKGQRILLTGHTGFKGTWLIHLMHSLGGEIHGFSHRNYPFFEQSEAIRKVASHELGDIRDGQKLDTFMQRVRPDVVYHFAAEPLVLDGYKNPLQMMQVNFNGTVNAIESGLKSGVKKFIVVTTDKVYRPSTSGLPHDENSAIGGQDPYSASKSAADIAAQSYSHLARTQGINIQIVRGGNVIGGGDGSSNRIVPDIEQALANGLPLRVRNPGHVRPWQHVLDCIGGYLAIDQCAPSDWENNCWNVGPSLSEKSINVSELVNEYFTARGRTAAVESSSPRVLETAHLRLDVGKLESLLNWRPAYNQVQAISKTAEWYSMAEKKSLKTATESQLRDWTEIVSEQFGWSQQG